jgi:hypothetical protein
LQDYTVLIVVKDTTHCFLDGKKQWPRELKKDTFLRDLGDHATTGRAAGKFRMVAVLKVKDEDQASGAAAPCPVYEREKYEEGEHLAVLKSAYQEYNVLPPSEDDDFNLPSAAGEDAE